MKTAEAELSCHINIDLQAGFYCTEIGNKCEKKTFTEKPKKNLYFTKKSLLKKPLFSKEPARGPGSF